MKKKLLSLMVIGVLLCLPFTVFAIKLTPSIPYEKPVKETENADGTVDKTYNILVAISDIAEGETVDFGSGDGEKFSFTFGTAIEKYSCAGEGDFVSSSKPMENNTGECTFTLPSDSSTALSGTVTLGSITITVDKTAADEDCTVKWAYRDSSATINPDTGVALPIAIIATGLAIAVGVYFVTKKRTKLYKI